MPQRSAVQVKGKAEVQVAVKYTVHPGGAIDSAWDVDARKALPAPLPTFMYWYAPAAYSMCTAWAYALNFKQCCIASFACITA